MAIPRTLGRVIRARRIELGLTQEELAQRIDPGFRQSDVSRLERDRIALPRRPRLEAIAAALGLDIGELLSVSGWVGADDAFASREQAQPKTAGAATRTSAALAGVSPVPAITAEEVERLRAAIAHAHDLRVHAAELLRRSHAFTRMGERSGWSAH